MRFDVAAHSNIRNRRDRHSTFLLALGIPIMSTFLKSTTLILYSSPNKPLNLNPYTLTPQEAAHSS